MNAEAQSTVTAPGIKIVTAWAAVGVTSWADFASVLAAFYTILLICEWFWKKFVRPFFERKGWIERIRRRREDYEYSDAD